ncbi:MAG: tandem-95 repeat protein, partial [Candidatus Omnitrophica bacterium]|nr:tandem-95 repeat protein [Candidatus Omnitrophota bacterium]
MKMNLPKRACVLELILALIILPQLQAMTATQSEELPSVTFSQSAASETGKTKAASYVPNEVLVRFKEGAIPREILSAIGLEPVSIESILPVEAAVSRFRQDYKLEKSSDGWYWFLGKQYKEVDQIPAQDLFKEAYAKMSEEEKALYRSYKITLPEGKGVEETINSLSALPEVESAQPNYIMKPYMTPNDTYYSSLWAMQPSRLNCPAAWDLSQGDNVVVAVIDTGVDYTHEDLSANIWTNSLDPINGVDNDGNGYLDDYRGWDFGNNDNNPMDYDGHGTHCSGTIAAVGNNSKGVIGVAPKAKIMPIKGFSDGGSSSTSIMTNAIYYAAGRGAKVLSNSWGLSGGGASDPLLETAVNYAYNSGCVVVFAAGNDAVDVANYPPANNPNVIAVAATDSNDARASFSNYGSAISVAAPGVNIASTYPASLSGGYPPYVYSDGTSMACPHVSGLAALILKANPGLTNRQVRHVLERTAVDLGAAGKDIYFGYGRINAYHAVTEALRYTNSAPVLSSIGDKTATAGVLLQFTVTATDQDNDPISYSVSSLPNGASFNSSTRVFSWTPGISQTGTYQVTFTVSDSLLSDSETIAITVIPPTIPDAPANLSALFIGTNQINLAWQDNSDNESGFKLERAVSSAGPFTQIYASQANTTTYSDTGLTSGTTYYYRICANNIAGNSGYSNTASATASRLQKFLPAAPENLVAQAASSSVVNLSWLDNSGNENGFKIERAVTQNGIFAGVGSTGANITAYSDSGLTGGITYYYRVCAYNSKGDSDYSNTASATTVRANNPPVLNAIGSKSVNENQLLQFAVSATDPDNDTLTYSATGLPSGASFNSSTKTFAWTPGYTQAGTYQVTFTVSDGMLTDSEAVTITVANVNRAPELAAIGNKSITAGQLLQFTVSATDPDNDTLTYSVNGLPNGAGFNSATKTFSWTPASTQVGTYQVTFSVTDGTLGDSETVTIMVTTNQPPVLSPIGNKSVNENQLLQFTLSATDPENSALTYSATGLPGGASFNASTKTFSWTPSFTQAGTYQVTFTVSDGMLTDSEAVTITVANVNRAPELAAIGNKSVNAGQQLQFTVSASDPDNDTLTYSATGLPSGASFNASTRGCSWTPASNQAGNHQMTFSVSDGQLTDSETITATVILFIVPDAPSNLTAVAVSNEEIGLSWQDNANNETGFKIERSTSAAGPFSEIASVSVNSNAYTDSGLSAGVTYYYRVRAYNNSGNSNYTNIASATVLSRSEQKTLPGAPTSLNAIAISSSQINLSWEDASNGPTNKESGFKIERATATSGLFIVIATTGANITVYSDSGLSGGMAYYYRVYAYNNRGGSGYSNTAYATTASTNQPPVLSPIGNKSVNENQLLQFTLSATDPENSALTYSATGL